MAGGLACLAPGVPGRGVAVRERRGQDGGMRSSIAGLRCIRIGIKRVVRLSEPRDNVRVSPGRVRRTQGPAAACFEIDRE